MDEHGCGAGSFSWRNQPGPTAHVSARADNSSFPPSDRGLRCIAPGRCPATSLLPLVQTSFESSRLCPSTARPRLSRSQHRPRRCARETLPTRAVHQALPVHALPAYVSGRAGGPRFGLSLQPDSHCAGIADVGGPGTKCRSYSRSLGAGRVQGLCGSEQVALAGSMGACRPTPVRCSCPRPLRTPESSSSFFTQPLAGRRNAWSPQPGAYDNPSSVAAQFV